MAQNYDLSVYQKCFTVVLPRCQPNYKPMPSEKDESRFLTRFFLFIFPEHRFRSVVQMFILDHILK